MSSGIIFALVISSLSVLAPAAAADLTQAEKERFRDTAIVVGTVKASLRNPESVKWELIAANDDASVVCIQYRAQNGFGGMGREITVYANGITSQSVAAWNKHCAKRLNDMGLVGGYVDKTFARTMKY
jgi:hypothetical protein